MNEQNIRAVIAINNQCIEQFQNRSFIHALSELRDAIALMNQGVTIIVNPRTCTSTSDLTYDTGVQLQTSSSMPAQTSQGITNNHRLQQQASATTLSVQIKFCLLEEPSINGTACAPTPIVPSFHLLGIVSVDQNATRPSVTEQQHQIRNIDTISKEDSYLISAALLHNMGILFHQRANACTHDTSSNSSLIVQVLNIYELLIQLCNHVDIWNVNSTQDPMQDHCFDLRVIQMLAYNNYGVICYNAGKYDMYQHCMKKLQCQLHFFPNLRRNDGSNLPNSDEFEIIYNNLRWNALFAKLFPSLILASAA